MPDGAVSSQPGCAWTSLNKQMCTCECTSLRQCQYCKPVGCLNSVLAVSTGTGGLFNRAVSEARTVSMCASDSSIAAACCRIAARRLCLGCMSCPVAPCRRRLPRPATTALSVSVKRQSSSRVLSTCLYTQHSSGFTRQCGWQQLLAQHLREREHKPPSPLMLARLRRFTSGAWCRWFCLIALGCCHPTTALKRIRAQREPLAPPHHVVFAPGVTR
jgi:hypothetical protein